MALSELIMILFTGITGLSSIIVIITYIFKGQWEVIFLGVGTYICCKACINSLYWLNARVGKIKWLKNNMKGSGEVNE